MALRVLKLYWTIEKRPNPHDGQGKDSLTIWPEVCIWICTGVHLIPASNNPRTANDPQIVSQMIPGQEIIQPYKVGNGMESMKSLWMEIYFLCYHRWKKISNSDIKSSNNKRYMCCEKYQLDLCQLYKVFLYKNKLESLKILLLTM